MNFDADVAIIGYGPTGVSAANALGALGVTTTVFERSTDIYPRARAVTVNDWTLRCFQSVGLDAALKANMNETHSLRWVTYDGTVLRHVYFPPGNLGHASSYAIYQPTMEQTLRDGASRYSDHVDVHYGVHVADLTQDDGGVTLTTIAPDTGRSASVRVRYALACDGGSSKMRERLGIPMLGDTIDTRWVVIDAKVKRWWPNRQILTMWSDRKRPVVDIALANGNHRWELPLEPDESEEDFQTPDQLWRLLGTMGVTPEQVEIHKHAFYKHHVRRAARWREGRVFLLGDAAHLMPPWAGQGMQSGIRDAFNLGWKLAATLSGTLPDALLDSYQQEREPDVAQWTAISVYSGRVIKMELSDTELAAMRLPPDAPRQTAPVAAPALHAGWLNGRTGGKSAVGKMIPQPFVATADGKFDLLDNIIGSGLVLLGDAIDPATLMSMEERAQWDRLGASARRVLGPDQHAIDVTDIIDINGVLIDWMRAHGARVLAVRPDRFVAATDAQGLLMPVAMPAANASNASLETGIVAVVAARS